MNVPLVQIMDETKEDNSNRVNNSGSTNNNNSSSSISSSSDYDNGKLSVNHKEKQHLNFRDNITDKTNANREIITVSDIESIGSITTEDEEERFMTREYIRERAVKLGKIENEQHPKRNDYHSKNEPTLDACCALDTPLRRRLQTLAIACHVSTIPSFVALGLILLSIPFSWIFMIPYAFYYFWDRTPANGQIAKRYSPWFRSLPIWTYMCEYFPITIRKTCDLQPTYTKEENPTSHHNINNKSTTKRGIRLWPTKLHLKYRFPKDDMIPTGPRYIFGYHPHGIGAIGAFGTFATEGCGWSKLFPGIPVSLMTLVTQFHAPLYRDYLMALGLTSVSRKNALKVLANNQSICIVVGGVSESLLGSNEAYELILNKRKGFIKLAIRSGNTSLVPVFGFGETNCFKIFETEKGSILNRIQLWIKKSFGFTIPIFVARGLFNYDFGLIPFRTPLSIVIGKPIYVKEKVENPSPALVDYYHDLYVEELKRIFYENRHKYGAEKMELQIVG